MALDLGHTTHQLLSALDGVVSDARSRAQRLDDAIDRALAVPADEAAFRTSAVGRRPYISARTGAEGLLGGLPPPEIPKDWTAVAVDGSHIDVDRHLPLRCHLINLGGCAITYGRDFGCQLFSEPTLAVADADLYLRPPDGASGETLIAGPLLAALRTVREVERLADFVDELPVDRPILALLDGTLAFWDLQRGQYPRHVAETLIGDRLSRALARLRDASQDGRPVAVAAYTSRPRTTEAAGAVRLMLCDQGDADCNRLCTARHSQREVCDAAAGFDDRELFELLLEPGHRSPLYRSSHLAARFALGLATGQEWSHFYYLNGGAEIARVEVPDWLAQDPELLALGHAMLVRQCQLGLGYPVAISESHEQAVITGHDREEFRRMALMLLEQRGLPTPESAKSFSKAQALGVMRHADLSPVPTRKTAPQTPPPRPPPARHPRPGNSDGGRTRSASRLPSSPLTLRSHANRKRVVRRQTASQDRAPAMALPSAVPPGIPRRPGRSQRTDPGRTSPDDFR